MIEELIKKGEELDSEAIEGMTGKYFQSVNFEQWASKAILYLESYHGSSSVTEKAKEKFRSLNSNTNYQFYQFILGALKAVKEFDSEPVDYI